MTELPGPRFDLGEDIEMLRASVRSWAQAESGAARAEIDRSDQFPMDAWKKMGDLGVLGITVAEEYGGANMGYLAHMIAMEEIIARVGVGRPVLWCALQPVREPDPPQRLGRPEGQLPAQAGVGRARSGALAMSEPNAGLGRGQHEAARRFREGDRYVLNGTKMWITNGPDCDVLVVYAKTEPDLGARGMTAFIVEKGMKGFSVAQSWTSWACAAPHGRTGVPGCRGAGGEHPRRRGQRRRQGADERARLRARGAVRRPGRHHAGVHGRGDAVHPRPQAVWPEHRRVPADPGQGGGHVHHAAGRAQLSAMPWARTWTRWAAATCARSARIAPR